MLRFRKEKNKFNIARVNFKHLMEFTRRDLKSSSS